MSQKKNNRIIFWSLVGILCFSLFSYGYFIQRAIVNIVARQGLERDLALLSSKVANLEADYIKAKNAITLESAQSKGFVAISNQKFVTSSEVKTANGLSVNLGF